MTLCITLQKLEQHVELLNKNHKHELGIERARLREANSQMAKQQTNLQELQKLVKVEVTFVVLSFE